MTVSRDIRAETLALGKKVLMALALCCYLVMKIETQPLPPFAREVILQQTLKSTAATGPESPIQKLPIEANIFSLSSTKNHQWLF